jgi:photosystem II stability/assembly factor-like uncharacterized protein
MGKPGCAIQYTEDGGQTWKDAKLDVELSNDVAEGLCMANAQVGWAVAVVLSPRTQVLLKTVDGGKSWAKQNQPALEKCWVLGQIWFDSAGKKGWINTNNGPIFMTKNGGVNWAPVEVANYTGGPFTYKDKPMPASFTHAGMHVFSFEHVMLGGMGGLFLETTDAGTSWTARQVPVKYETGANPGITGLHFAADGKSGWAIGGDGKMLTNPNGHAQFESPIVMRTKDGGQTWERVKIPSVNPANDVWAISADEAWLCSRRGYGMQTPPPGYLLHTTDGGKTWSDESPGTGSLWKLAFPDKAHGFASGGAGGGVEAESTLVLITP